MRSVKRGDADGGTCEVILRDVDRSDLSVFFTDQLDPVAIHMAAFASRDEPAFMAHWSKILADESVIKQTIVYEGKVAGNIVCFEQTGRRYMGYWIGRVFWGKGVATHALRQFLEEHRTRPLHAYVATHNIGSIRVLEKCGFVLDESSPAAVSTDDGGVEEFLFTLAS